MEIDISKITRFEVIDEDGRVYTKWNCKIEPHVQNDGRTLKVFVQYKGGKEDEKENEKANKKENK